MHYLPWALVLSPLVILLACLVLFPLVLMLLGRRRPPGAGSSPAAVTIVITCHNEADELPGALEALLVQRWNGVAPQVIVASDASTDGTDAIAELHVGAGVTLHRHEPRGGKTVVENGLLDLVTGDVICFMDAASRPDRECMTRMMAAFSEPDVGVVSSRDVSASAYVSYEMWLRDLETKAGGIVGASGSLYAIRRPLFVPLAPHATRDFASVLLAHDRGLRAVSVPAHCVVRPGTAPASEGERLSRTMTHGMTTLVYYRRWLHPLTRPGFVLKLLCHKVARWLLLPAMLVAGVMAFALVGSQQGGGAAVGAGCVLLLGWLGVRTWMVASLLSWKRLLAGQQTTHWEPTRR